MKQVMFPVVSGSPDSPEWHAWRAGGIGGSDAPVIATAEGLCSPASWMKSLHDLWLLKTGQKKSPPANPAMMRGRKYEEPARLAYEAHTGIMVTPAFGEMDLPGHEFVRCSFDGISFDGNIVTEIKVPSQKVHAMAQNGEVVGYYLPQLAHQGLVAWGHPDTWHVGQEFNFASFVPETGSLAIVSVKAPALASMAAQLLKAEAVFWDMVVKKLPPAGNEWVEAARKYLAIEADLEAIKEAKDEARQRLIDLLGNQDKQEGGGVMVYRTASTGRVDYRKAFETLAKQTGTSPDFVEAFRGKETESICVKASSHKEKEPAPRLELVPATDEEKAEAHAW